MGTVPPVRRNDDMIGVKYQVAVSICRPITYLATFLDELAKFVKRSDEVFKMKRFLVFAVAYC